MVKSRLNQFTLLMSLLVAARLFDGLGALPLQTSTKDDVKVYQIKMAEKHMTELLRKGDVAGLMEIFKQARKRNHNEKMRRCMEVLRYRTICNQSASFYIWAQLYAKEVILSQDTSLDP